MDVEEGHDEECTVGRAEIVSVHDVAHVGREVAVGEGDGLGPACCAGGVEDEGDVVGLRACKWGDVGESPMLELEAYVVVDEGDFGDCGVASACCTNRRVISFHGSRRDKDEDRVEVGDVEVKFVFRICWIERGANGSLTGNCEERDDELVAVRERDRDGVAMLDA
jgi:hypothetical protein